ncbi:hypothetical protein HK405_006833 [Cladochytrium tenue]|nr:hypothetical protein HK405_006833 [Cladochytrium tenue]
MTSALAPTATPAPPLEAAAIPSTVTTSKVDVCGVSPTGSEADKQDHSAAAAVADDPGAAPAGVTKPSATAATPVDSNSSTHVLSWLEATKSDEPQGAGGAKATAEVVEIEGDDEEEGTAGDAGGVGDQSELDHAGAALDQTIVSTALQTIVLTFGRQDLVAWIGTAYLISSASFALIFGKAAEVFGRKWVLVVALVIFEAGSAVCGASQSMDMLVVGRALAGVGGGGILALVVIIVSDIVSLRYRGQFQGIVGAAMGLAAVLGPIIGGTLSDGGLWRIGGVTVLIVSTLLRFPSPPGRVSQKLSQLDLIGAPVCIAAVVCFLTPLQLGGVNWSWSAPQTVALFVVSAALFAAFAAVEWRVSPHPMLPREVFSSWSVTMLLGVCFGIGNVFLAAVYYAGTGSSLSRSNLFRPQCTTTVAGIVVFAIASGAINSLTGRYYALILFGAVVSGVGLGLVSLLGPSSSTAEQAGYLFVLGAGIGSILQTAILGVQASVALPEIPIASAAAEFFQTLGGAVGIAVTGSVISNTIRTNAESKAVLQEVLTLLRSAPQFAEYQYVLDPAETVQLRAVLSDAQVVAALPQATEALAELVDSFAGAFSQALRVLVAFAGLALVAGLFVRERVHRRRRQGGLEGAETPSVTEVAKPQEVVAEV